MIPKNKDAKKFAIMACEACHLYKIDGSFFPYIGELNKHDTIESILRQVFDEGISEGIKRGKEELQIELKTLLGIEENEN